jgi:phosphoserine phosphatase RsbU/P
MTAAPGPDLEQLFDEAPCGHLVAGTDGRLLVVNATLCRWLQYDRATVLERMKLPDLLSVGGRIFFQTHVAPLLRMQGSVAEVKVQLRRRDGSEVPVIFNAIERSWGGQPVIQLAAFVAEDRHKYERELLQQRRRAEELAAQNAQGQEQLAAARAEAEDRAIFAEKLVGMVSHDIRNPLSVIHMSTVLLERGGISEQQRNVVARISRAVDRVRTLIGDLLDFTQAKLGRGLSMNLRDMDLHQIIGDSVADLQVAFAGREVRHVRGAGSGACVADADRIVQAVGNLVSNAATHGAPGRPITVTTTRTAHALTIAVHNEGQPIPPELVPTLFQPLVRGTPERSGDGGIGLGLFIVQQIVQRHGGSAGVESTEDGGTTFTLTIPCA